MLHNESDNIEAIIFDMDGVLVDTFEAHFHAWQKFLAAKNFKGFNRKIYYSFIGMQTSEILQMFRDKYHLDIDPDKDKYVKESMIDVNEISLFPKVKGTLVKLRKARFKIGLATSAIREDMLDRLDRYGIRSYFDSFTCSDEVTLAKPNPEIYLLAAKKLKVQPEKCIVVEDALNGIMAAKSAGMYTIALTTTFKKQSFDELKPDFIYDSIGEINVRDIKGL